MFILIVTVCLWEHMVNGKDAEALVQTPKGSVSTAGYV